MEMNGIDSWKVVLYLLPVALAMLWVRRREAAVGVTQFRDLLPAQKAWILLVALPPGASALLMDRLSEEQIRGYMGTGAAIAGSGQNLVPGVVRQFVAQLPPDWTRGAGRDLDELLALVTRQATANPDHVAALLVQNWPPPVWEPPVLQVEEAAAPQAEAETAEPGGEAEAPAAPPIEEPPSDVHP